jgi:hypothetical protein
VPLVQREYPLPLPPAGYQSLCVSSQLSASALCSNANHFIPAHCSLLFSSLLMHASAQSIYLLFIKNNCYCSTSRSLVLLPDALIDILHLHNSHWLLFHPRAVTPLGSSPRTRVAASVHYACSHLCTCDQGDQIHPTYMRSESQVSYLPLATRGQFGSGFDLIMTTTAKSSRLLLHFTACNHSSERYSVAALCFCSELSALSAICSVLLL